ncbi:NAD(P)H-dependent flavin oxidoreductase [Sneathiella limimaris]|uniref:NAD(P)H-dependent flavin oxidoreductase n=1 Tax=Sneathiella limimaris TaxID=1964213 RepID=UPI00146ABD49|nr:nitronate monooxygenase [Sneathiella limimaris]
MSETPSTEGLEALNNAWERGCTFLGTEYAILGGAMSWVSERNLVAAISNAGGFGVIACGAMTPDLLDAEIKATKELTTKPFGVNLITMHPELDTLVDICLENNVGHVVLAGGLPSKDTIARVKEGGAKIICFTPTLALGKKLVRSGVDALVIEGMEAGGHIGPVSTSVLAQEILPNITDVPIFVAGGIGRGEAIANYLRMGAAGVQLGTRFVCAEECVAHPDFKRAFIRASARDAITTVQVDPQFPVIPVRALGNEGSKKFIETQHEVIAKYRAGEMDMESAQLAIEHYWAGALRRAVIDGDVEHGSVMAGQSVGMVKKEQPTSEILQELVTQAADALVNPVGRKVDA